VFGGEVGMGGGAYQKCVLCIFLIKFLKYLFLEILSFILFYMAGISWYATIARGDFCTT
jgi:hypothetical protein